MSTFHIGELKAKPEHRDELLKSLEVLKEQPGFIDCVIYQSDTDENHFTTIEEWESTEDHQRFLDAMSKDAFEEWVDMLTEQPKSGFFKKV